MTKVMRYPLRSAPVIGETVLMQEGAPGRVLHSLPHPPGSRPGVLVVVSSHPACSACGVGRMTWDPDGRGVWRCGRCQHAPDDNTVPRDGERQPQTVYIGQRDADGRAIVTRPDGSLLEAAPSLALRRHSPDGFEWGYLGSGPAQLALGLLLDHSGDTDLALRLYQRFKTAHVARWREVWAIDPAELSSWLLRTVERTPGAGGARAGFPRGYFGFRRQPSGRWVLMAESDAVPGDRVTVTKHGGADVLVAGTVLGAPFVANETP